MMEIRNDYFKVYLRTPVLEDATSIGRISNDIDTAHNMGNEFPSPYTAEDAIRLIEIATVKLGDHSGFYFVIRNVETNEVAGICGINIDQKNMKGELTFWLGRAYMGKGAATQALLLLIGFCFKNVGLNRLYANVLKSNEGSAKLLISLGFSEEGILRQSMFSGATSTFDDTVMLSMLKSEYKDDTNFVVS